jgi:hypothetical protein
MSWPENMKLGPIETWPTTRTPAHARRASPFRSSLGHTLQVLDRELHALSATGARLELAIPPGPAYWRQDGRPRAHVVADHPGVVLAFTAGTLGGRELRYATDRFLTWQDNLRAVALGLEALRRVERYGIAQRGEQYAGWAALTSGQDEGDPVRGALEEDLRRLDDGIAARYVARRTAT